VLVTGRGPWLNVSTWAGTPDYSWRFKRRKFVNLPARKTLNLFSKDNILIKPNYRACLADFGLALVKDDQKLFKNSSSKRAQDGTVRWQAPELLDPETDFRKVRSTDVYAFSCVCIEVCCSSDKCNWPEPVMLAGLYGKSTISRDPH
jgi:serine/threonine protein kinase